MKYRISPKFLRRKKYEPIFSALWGLLLGCLVFAAVDSVPWYFGVGFVLLVAVLAGSSNLIGSRRIIQALENHVLELRGRTLVICENAMNYEIDLDSIHRVVIDKRKENIVAISIERVKGQKERLPPYGDLVGLAENLGKVLPTDKLKVRGWFHI